MKWWVFATCLVAAYVVVPACIHWLRHRPHRLTQGTQHILWAGLLVQFVLLGAAIVALWLA